MKTLLPKKILLPSERKAMRQKRVMYAIYGVATPIVLLWLFYFVLIVSGIYHL